MEFWAEYAEGSSERDGCDFGGGREGESALDGGYKGAVNRLRLRDVRFDSGVCSVWCIYLSCLCLVQ